MIPIYVIEIDRGKHVGRQGAASANPSPYVGHRHARFGFDPHIRTAELFPETRKEPYRDHSKTPLLNPMRPGWYQYRQQET